MLPSASAFLSHLCSICFLKASVLPFYLGSISKSWTYDYLEFFIPMCWPYVFYIWLCLILTKRSGDIEQNPGPKSNYSQSFFICHWNFNSISAHNFIKISLLKPYIATHKLDDQKPILTPAFQMMMTIWKFLVMIYSEQTTHLILKEAVFVFIIETLFP